jgi:predicted nucleic acid-binding protein
MTPIPPNDLWIAAECVSIGLPLVTRDRDFDHIPQLSRV